MEAADALRAARGAGVEVEVDFAEGNALVQIHQLFAHIHAPEGRRPTAILVESVAGEGLERVARNAVKAGIGWILLNTRTAYLESLRHEYPRLPLSMVSVDQEEIGRIQARQARALLPGGGSVLYLQGPPDSPAAQDRLRLLQEGIGGAGIDLRVLNGKWTEAGGQAAVASWLRLKTSDSFRPDLVVSQNDAMAVGAWNAIVDLRKDWAGVPVTGCDGLPEEGVRLVDAGRLAATIVTPPTAGTAVALVARSLAGEELPPQVILTPRSHPAVDAIARRGGPPRR
jgi:ABC-type sugar transport system substrate-binding protein